MLLSCGIYFCSKAQTTASQYASPHGTDSTFTKVESESSFPGGEAGWKRFLMENMVYPKKPLKKMYREPHCPVYCR